MNEPTSLQWLFLALGLATAGTVVMIDGAIMRFVNHSRWNGPDLP